MTPRVSVVMASHSRPRTMPIAAASVLAQTFADLELLLVLDGPDDDLRRSAAELAARDERVRVLDRPKAARNGEVHKAEAVASAAAPMIAYCGDDDLWLPWHLERLLPAAEGRGPALVHSLLFLVRPDGSLTYLPCDLRDAGTRAMLFAGDNRFGPTQTVHTADALDGTTSWAVPDEGPGDLWLWLQVLARDEVDARTLPELTVLSFPTPLRPDWSDAQRAEELGSWAARLASDRGIRELHEAAIAAATAEAVRQEGVRIGSDAVMRETQVQAQAQLDAYARLVEETQTRAQAQLDAYARLVEETQAQARAQLDAQRADQPPA